MTYKVNLRRQQRAMRRELNTHQRSGYDQSIQRHVLNLLRSQQAARIAAYLAFDGEPDISPLCRQLLGEGIEVALPVITGGSTKHIEFHSWQTDSVLKCSRFGINEPHNTPVIALAQLDILLIPLVAYDRCGNRLGMGAGYYDRSLAPLRDSHTPLRVGVAYSLQELAGINKNEWDIPLHGVINENGWTEFEEN